MPVRSKLIPMIEPLLLLCSTTSAMHSPNAGLPVVSNPSGTMYVAVL